MLILRKGIETVLLDAVPTATYVRISCLGVAKAAAWRGSDNTKIIDHTQRNIYIYPTLSYKHDNIKCIAIHKWLAHKLATNYWNHVITFKNTLANFK